MWHLRKKTFVVIFWMFGKCHALSDRSMFLRLYPFVGNKSKHTEFLLGNIFGHVRREKINMKNLTKHVLSSSCVLGNDVLKTFCRVFYRVLNGQCYLISSHIFGVFSCFWDIIFLASFVFIHWLSTKLTPPPPRSLS